MNVQNRARVLNIEFLREQLRSAVSGGNLRRIAREANVAPNTLYGFVDPDTPTTPQGDTLAKLETWVRRQASVAVGASDRRIGEISGRARAVQDFLRQALKEQAEVIAALERLQPAAPPDAELEQSLLDATQRAVAPAPNVPTGSGSARRDRD